MTIPRDYAVLVFDMAHTGEADAEHTISGFRDEAAAQAYAEARVRDSVEELRKPGQTTMQLSQLWHLYGEDCVVIGGRYKGREHLARYLVTPATQAERAWSAIAPRPRRFRAAVLIGNKEGETVWAGGIFRQIGRPAGADLLVRFSGDARQAFQRHGIEPSDPVSVQVATLHELRDPPLPPSGQPLQNWKVTVEFVCHDIKFGHTSQGVFAWPVEPKDDTLRSMAAVVVSDAIAVRGDDPSCVDYTDFLSIAVETTDQSPNYPVD